MFIQEHPVMALVLVNYSSCLAAVVSAYILIRLGEWFERRSEYKKYVKKTQTRFRDLS